MIRNYEYKMSGAYSDIQTRKIVTLEERETDQGDAPCHNVIDQIDFDYKMAAETWSLC